jgi:prepilin-type N-terminal cleavage/methylation domain-containing protein
MKNYSAANGFTLMEISIGIVIVSLILIFSYSSVNFSAAVSSDMEEQAKAANILETAAEQIFNMRGSSFSSITTGMSLTSSNIPLMLDFRNPSISVAVSSYGGNNDLKSVQITFSWSPASQKPTKTQTLRTLVSKPPS